MVAAPIRRFLFLGAPGVGKGTFAGIIAPQLDLDVVTAGDLVRAEIRKGGNDERSQALRQIVEEGRLVPDEIMVPLVADGLPRNESANGKGYILDGFPRTVAQAQALDAMLAAKGLGPIQRAMNIVLEDWVAIAKMLGRQQCARCQRSFNSAHIVQDGYDMPALPPPSTAGECPTGHQDDCPASRGASGLTRRSDDNEATIQQRLAIYKQEITPLLDFYEERGILRSFHVKKGVKDAPALQAVMTGTE